MRLKNKWTIQILIVDTALINSYIAWTQLSWMRLGIFSWGLPVCMLSCVWLIVTPCTVAHVTVALQAPLSMGFSRQEYWDGLPCPPPGDLPDPGIEPRSPTLQEDTLPSEPPGNTMKYYSAIKGNEALIHATTWVNLESIMLKERSQTQKTPYCMISFIWHAQKRTLLRQKTD